MIYYEKVLKVFFFAALGSYRFIGLGDSQVVLVVKNLPVQETRDESLIPGWGRSPGGGNDSPLQYSCLEIPWTQELGGLQSMGSQE